MTNRMKVNINTGGAMAGFIDGDKWVQVTKSHPEYEALLKATVENDPDTFLEIYNRNCVNFSREKYEMEEELKVEAKTVTYRGRVIDDPVLVRVIQNFGTQCDALKKFLDNLFLNPSWKSVEQLAQFLEHNNFPLTEDGCFLGYKAIRPDWTDLHTGTIDNSIGTTPRMKRADVAFDPKVACSSGLHVGTHNYASNFGGRDSILIVVKVNPAHCVSVPFDHSSEKLRCSEYNVIGVCTGLLPLDRIYTMAGTEITPANYFAELVDKDGGRRRRPSKLTPIELETDIVDEDDDFEDWEDDEDPTEYICDNSDCQWTGDISDNEWSVGGTLAFCPKCGNELETR